MDKPPFWEKIGTIILFLIAAIMLLIYIDLDFKDKGVSLDGNEILTGLPVVVFIFLLPFFIAVALRLPIFSRSATIQSIFNCLGLGLIVIFIILIYFFMQFDCFLECTSMPTRLFERFAIILAVAAMGHIILYWAKTFRKWYVQLVIFAGLIFICFIVFSIFFGSIYPFVKLF